jgi:aryl-alcohol dehydrogenase-like predicted oxidoreductase
MHYKELGRTGLKVSTICMGTMTMGRQNTESEGHAQLDMAVAEGINFIDTAEMYPVPRDPKLFGDTERIIGSWLKSRGGRDKLILATKVAGPANVSIRPGQRLDRRNIEAAIDASLQRLQTDYIDLYQVHWPDRPANFFGTLGFKAIKDKPGTVPIAETLEALADLVKAGKVRHIGVSNETPWGVHEYLRLSQEKGWPRIQSIQNPYNLLNRSFEVGLAEMALREDVPLLAYSPLAMGLLTGKYHQPTPASGRLTLFPEMSRYRTDLANQVTAKYLAVARDHGLDPAQMALAYVLAQPFLCSVIIGATTLEQLKTDIAAWNLELPQSAVDAIEEIHNQHSNPCP